MDLTRITDTLIGDKRRWRAYKARVRRLPPDYRAAVDAFEKYLMNLGPGDGPGTAAMVEDLADLFEQAAADGTSIRDVVGDDPVEFVETFLANYAKGGWVARQRQKLTRAIEAIEQGGVGQGSPEQGGVGQDGPEQGGVGQSEADR